MTDEQKQPLEDLLQSAIEEAVRQKADWSERQAFECIMQAMRCGDFVHLIQGDTESFVYIPFAKAREYESNIADLQKEVEQLRTENNALKSENGKLTKERREAQKDARYIRTVAGVK